MDFVAILFVVEMPVNRTRASVPGQHRGQELALGGTGPCEGPWGEGWGWRRLQGVPDCR